jgi:hypothetical protein
MKYCVIMLTNGSLQLELWNLHDRLLYRVHHFKHNLNYKICARFSKISMSTGLVCLQHCRKHHLSELRTCYLTHRMHVSWKSVISQSTVLFIASLLVYTLETHHEQQQTISIGSNVWERTYVLLMNTPCLHLCKWWQEQPTEQGVYESTVLRKVGRVYYMRGTAFDFTSIPQHIIFGWAVF